MARNPTQTNPEESLIENDLDLSEDTPGTDGSDDGGFGALSVYDENDEGGDENEPAPEPVSQGTDTGEAPQGDAPEAEPEAAPEPEAEQSEPSTQETPSTPVEPEASPEVPHYEPMTPEKRREAANQLSTNFKLSETDVEALNNGDWEQVLPRVAAEATVLAVEAATSTLMNQLPNMVVGQIGAYERYQQAEKQFFSEWPQLSEHRDLVHRLGVEYRARNPSAPRDQFIREVGAQAMLAARIPLEGSAGSDQAKASKGHQPAGKSGRAAPPPPPSRPANEFEDLALSDVDMMPD